MAFIVGDDTRNTKEIGQGQIVSGFSRQVYFLDSASITNYDPEDPASAWVRIKYVEDFQGTEDSTELVAYDGRETDHTIAGRKDTTISISQSYVSWHESIEKLENKQVFYMEAIGDDREPEDATGKRIFQEMVVYDGKLAKFSKEKPTDGLYKTQGEGKYNSATVKRIFRKLTPITITATPNGGSSATVSSAKTINVSATDIYGASVDLLVANNEEISSVTVTKVSGPAFTQAGTNSAPTVTYSATGTSVIKITVTTKGNFTATSSDITLTVS